MYGGLERVSTGAAGDNDRAADTGAVATVAVLDITLEVGRVACLQLLLTVLERQHQTAADNIHELRPRVRVLERPHPHRARTPHSKPTYGDR